MLAKEHQSGTTIVETIVSIGLFTTFMLVVVGSYMSVSDAARKTRANRIALDNVSASLDYMSREIRLGMYFHCENDAVASNPTTVNGFECPYSLGVGGILLAFERSGGSLANPNDQLVFWLENGRIWRSLASGGNPEALTAPEIVIQELRFYLDNTDRADVTPANADQPRISIIVRGVAGANPRTQTSFAVQTSLSARTPNIPPL